MKKIAAVFLAGLLAAGLAACDRDDDDRRDMAKTPSSSFVYEGDHYREVADIFSDCGFLNIRGEEITDLQPGDSTREGEVEEVLVGGTSNYQTDQWMNRNTEVVIRYHTAGSQSASAPAAAEAPVSSPAADTPSVSAPSSGSNVMTAENNADFASLVSAQASADALQNFARKNEDRRVEFDAYVAKADQHENEHDSYDYVIYAGDGESGTAFLLEDVENYEAGLSQALAAGSRIHLLAEIEDVDRRTGYLELDPITVSIR